MFFKPAYIFLLYDKLRQLFCLDMEYLYFLYSFSFHFVKSNAKYRTRLVGIVTFY
mgnify:CR=1 FL=1